MVAYHRVPVVGEAMFILIAVVLFDQKAGFKPNENPKRGIPTQI
jgi:hypothetical protein